MGDGFFVAGEGEEVIKVVFFFRDRGGFGFGRRFSGRRVFAGKSEEVVKAVFCFGSRRGGKVRLGFGGVILAVFQRSCGLVFGGQFFKVVEEVVVFVAVAGRRYGNRGRLLFRVVVACHGGDRCGGFVFRDFQVFEEVVRQFVGGVRFAVVVFVAVFGQTGEFFVEVVQFGELRIQAFQSVHVGAGVADFDFADFVADFLAFAAVHFGGETLDVCRAKFFDAVFVAVVTAFALGEHEGGGTTEGENAGACSGQQRQRQAAGDFVFRFFLGDRSDGFALHFRHDGGGGRCRCGIVAGDFHRRGFFGRRRRGSRFGLYGDGFCRGVVGGDFRRRVVGGEIDRFGFGAGVGLWLRVVGGDEGVGTIQGQRIAIQRGVFRGIFGCCRGGGGIVLRHLGCGGFVVLVARVVVLCQFGGGCRGVGGCFGFGSVVLCQRVVGGGSGCARSGGFGGIGLVFCRFFDFFRLRFGLGAVVGNFGFGGRHGSGARIGDGKGTADHQVAHVVMGEGATVGIVDGAHHLLDGDRFGRARGVGDGEQGFV